MRQLLQFLIDNPILIFILLAWVAGAVGNMVKAAKKAQQRQAGAPPVRRAPPANPGQRSAEEVAAEIRRALGLDPEPATRSRPEPAPPRAEPPPPPRPVVRPSLSGAERPPTPVAPTTGRRHLEVHVDPHVGEAMRRRSSLRSVTPSPRSLGQLGGGREQVAPRATAGVSRYSLGDVTRAIVLSEILGPPLANRPPRDV